MARGPRADRQPSQARDRSQGLILSLLLTRLIAARVVAKQRAQRWSKRRSAGRTVLLKTVRPSARHFGGWGPDMLPRPFYRAHASVPGNAERAYVRKSFNASDSR